MIVTYKDFIVIDHFMELKGALGRKINLSIVMLWLYVLTLYKVILTKSKKRLGNHYLITPPEFKLLKPFKKVTFIANGDIPLKT
jgi:hypothetical protein